MTRPPSKSCPICQCQFGDSDCIHINGIGTPDDPYIAVPNLDPDTDQLLEDGPAGFAAFAPPWLIDPPAVHIYATVSNTIAFDTPQGLFFNEVRYDTDSMALIEADESRLIIKTPGVYLVTLNVRWKKQDVSTGDVLAAIWKNRGGPLAEDSMPIGAADLYNSHSVSVEAAFEAGDYLEAIVKQDGENDDAEPLIGTVLAEHRLPSFSAAFLRPTP